MACQYGESKDRYYNSNKDSIILSSDGRKLIEDILREIPKDYDKYLSFKGTRGNKDK